ncbi:MAG: efflux RND transporter periplasmic adaptor subunit [bacterium]
MKKRTAVTIAIAVIALAAVLTGCGGHEAPRTAEAREAAPVAVQALTVRQASLPSFYEATGTVRARSTAVLSAKVMGYVREVNVNVGDRVRAGSTLAVLDSRDLEAGYRQAEAAVNEARSAIPEADNGIASAKAALDLAQVTFDRFERLYRKDSVSRQEFDETAMKLRVAQANYEMALARREQLKSKIAQAEQMLASAGVTRSYARITAPFDGVVIEKPVEPGNLAAPGQPLITIERAGGYRLEAGVEEGRLASVYVGQKVQVELDALGSSLEGRVAEIVPAIDAASRTFTAKIDLPPSPHLRSGLFGRARFPAAAREAITVPPEAVIERGQLISVYVADGGYARSRLVTIGVRDANRLEVLSGLTEGDHVIAPVPPGLADGARVEVR